mmetsp:Transcript_820/g.1734  ORF Transcript_820/g.1734 Transcript_820/m.1734 type:complete len:116 (-) Transcript_820:234-581(-)
MGLRCNPLHSFSQQEGFVPETRCSLLPTFFASHLPLQLALVVDTRHLRKAEAGRPPSPPAPSFSTLPAPGREADAPIFHHLVPNLSIRAFFFFSNSLSGMPSVSPNRFFLSSSFF